MELSLKPLSLLDGKEEWKLLNEIEPDDIGFTNDAPDIEFEEFPHWLLKQFKRANLIDLHPDLAQQYTYWLMRGDKPVGMGRIRPRLTNKLIIDGGNITCYIHKKERQNGYGVTLLSLLLEKAKTKGMDLALITCRPDNDAAIKTIEQNKGILQKEKDNTRWYWVYL